MTWRTMLFVGGSPAVVRWSEIDSVAGACDSATRANQCDTERSDPILFRFGGYCGHHCGNRLESDGMVI